MNESFTSQQQAAIRDKAMELQARRDHSVRELMQKLSVRFDAANIEPVLQQLHEQGLQSDERYAQLLVRSRARQGFGPLRIRLELMQKGVAAPLIDAVIEQSDTDWFENARLSHQKRFRRSSDELHTVEPRERARQYRFLQYRGYTSDQIRFAVEQDVDQE